MWTAGFHRGFNLRNFCRKEHGKTKSVELRRVFSFFSVQLRDWGRPSGFVRCWWWIFSKVQSNLTRFNVFGDGKELNVLASVMRDGPNPRRVGSAWYQFDKCSENYFRSFTFFLSRPSTKPATWTCIQGNYDILMRASYLRSISHSYLWI